MAEEANATRVWQSDITARWTRAEGDTVREVVYDERTGTFTSRIHVVGGMSPV